MVKDEDIVREALAFARRAAATYVSLGWRADGIDDADAALDRLVARAVVDEAERDSWRTLAEGWKLTDDVEQHRV